MDCSAEVFNNKKNGYQHNIKQAWGFKSVTTVYLYANVCTVKKKIYKIRSLKNLCMNKPYSILGLKLKQKQN